MQQVDDPRQPRDLRRARQRRGIQRRTPKSCDSAASWRPGGPRPEASQSSLSESTPARRRRSCSDEKQLRSLRELLLDDCGLPHRSRSRGIWHLSLSLSRPGRARAQVPALPQPRGSGSHSVVAWPVTGGSAGDSTRRRGRTPSTSWSHWSPSAHRSPRTGSRVSDRQRFGPLADGDSAAP